MHRENVKFVRQLQLQEIHEPGRLVATFEAIKIQDVTSFTLREKFTKNVTCYVSSGGCSKNEACSFLLHFIQDKVKNEGIHEFVFYCAPSEDNFVITSIVYSAAKFSVKIIQRFLESGHAQNTATWINLQLLHSRQAVTDIMKEKNYKVALASELPIFNFDGLSSHLSLSNSFYYKQARELIADGSVLPLKFHCASVSWLNPVVDHRRMNDDPSLFTLEILQTVSPQ